MTDLQKRYNEEMVPKLEKELGIKNPMGIPKLSKIVVNMGVKDAVNDKKIIEKMAVAIGQVTGQKAKPTRAKKAIAGFKIRQGDTIGLGVPRTSFDGRGNYTLGFHEYSTFPEIDPASVERLQGMEMIFVTTANDNEHGFKLLEALGMPFAKEAKS